MVRNIIVILWILDGRENYISRNYLSGVFDLFHIKLNFSMYMQTVIRQNNYYIPRFIKYLITTMYVVKYSTKYGYFTLKFEWFNPILTFPKVCKLITYFFCGWFWHNLVPSSITRTISCYNNNNQIYIFIRNHKFVNLHENVNNKYIAWLYFFFWAYKI